MATRRRTSAPRKTAKAASAPVKKSTSAVPTKVRPAKPNLNWEDYRDDVKVRWEIHQFETQELWNDLVKGYNYLLPFAKKTVNYVRESYDRAFNTTPENTEVK